MSLPDEAKIDHTLMRIKDFLLIAGSLGAMVFWIVGIVSLPDRVAKQEQRIQLMEARAAANDLVINTMQRDVSYMTKSLDEIKDLLKRRDHQGAS